LLLWRKGLSRAVGATFLVGFIAYTALQYYGVEKMLAGDSVTQATAGERANADKPAAR
jgi:hypothetical protein